MIEGMRMMYGHDLEHRANALFKREYLDITVHEIAPGLVYQVMCAARGGHTPDVTLHGSVKYALVKGKFYLLDNSGKEWQMTVLEKVLLTGAQN